ncbi:hypothetical protein [Streptomyces sp. NPDC047939]|uniref:hypothetical protein n=1 Tax=Streptomyces sp. NPDC047939 TaxID=3155381 RepID=UPI0034346C9C
MPEQPEPVAFVVMIGDAPIAVAHTMAAAMDAALTAEKRHGHGDGQYEYLWSEHSPTEWRLKSRRQGGDRNRFAWTLRSIRTAPLLNPAA